MDFLDYMWTKLIVLGVLAFIYGYIKARSKPPQ